MNLYTYEDVDGQSHQIANGQDFTTLVQRIDTEEESSANDGASIGSIVACEIQHRYSDLDGYDSQLLARWGITRTVVADPEPAPPTAPEVVSAMQLKRQLRTMPRTDGGSGTLRTQADTLVAGSGDGDLQDYYEYTSLFHRHHPKVVMMVAALGLSSDQADAAWLAASLLS